MGKIMCFLQTDHFMDIFCFALKGRYLEYDFCTFGQNPLFLFYFYVLVLNTKSNFRLIQTAILFLLVFN